MCLLLQIATFKPIINQLQCIEFSNGINTSNELAICQLDNVRKNEPFVAL